MHRGIEKALASKSGAVCTQAVLKVASRCNLNCSYCYVYNMGDDGWKSQPSLMNDEVTRAAIACLAAHAREHRLKHFQFIFHGGEPLLASKEFYSQFVERAQKSFKPPTQISFVMQTNAVLLNEIWASHLSDLGIRVGISLDSTPSSHDLERVDHRGKGSYDQTIAGFEIARKAGLDPGLLSVVDLRADPDEVFRHFARLRPRIVDFLLPQANWDRPPPHRAGQSYGSWLARIFNNLAAEETPSFRVRMFDKLMSAVLGEEQHSDAMGKGPNSAIIVETNGAIEPADVLRTCKNGITRRGFSVLQHSVDEALADPLARAYYFAADDLCETCRNCEINDLCAGGYLPHRYSEASFFDNPSVYCADLKKIIAEVQRWTVAQLPDDILQQTGLRALPEI